jgi:hypothetical protein
MRRFPCRVVAKGMWGNLPEFVCEDYVSAAGCGVLAALHSTGPTAASALCSFAWDMDSAFLLCPSLELSNSPAWER